MELMQKKLQENLLTLAQRTSFSTEMACQMSKHHLNLVDNCVSRHRLKKEDKSVFKDSESDITSADGYETEESDQHTASNTPSSQHWVNNTFSKPLQIVSRLSGYPNLVMIYSIFSCLAVSSASAERALSKLKIVKNLLRSSLSDGMLSSCFVLASEKDLPSIISNEEITRRLAQSIPSLRASLMYY